MIGCTYLGCRVEKKKNGPEETRKGNELPEEENIG